MRRRTALAALATLSTCGCLDRAIGSGPGPPETLRRVELAGIDGVGDPDLDATVTVEPEITTAETAVVTISLANHGDESREFEGGHSPPFSTVESDDGPAWLLVPPEWADRQERVAEDCWASTEPFVPPDDGERITLEPGEIAATMRPLWSHPEADPCLPTGRFSFTETLRELDGDRVTREIGWGFRLSVTDDDATDRRA